MKNYFKDMYLKCSLLLLSILFQVSAKHNGRANLLAHSVIPSVIPDAVFQLPLVEIGIRTTPSIDLRPQPWSLLEPRDFTGGHERRPARPVRYTGERLCDGACITMRACDYHQGHAKGACANGNVCCVFQKSCGGVSREKVSFFRSPQFPKSLNESLECSYRIYPSETTCALRLDFEKFELEKPRRQKQVEKCVDDVMFILNSAGGATEGVCELENHTAVVEVQPNSSHPIIISFVMQSEHHSWSLKITQVNCKKLQPWKNLPECGRQLMYEPNEYDSDGQMTPLDNLSRFRKSEERQPPHEVLYIINGKDAEIREFPWQVSIQSKSSSTHRCGGTIINDRYILTAAHCVYRYAYISKQKLKVVVGDFILDTEKDGEHEEFEIEKIVVHYNYKPSKSHANDIAVIKLNGTITFNDKVQPVCLPDEDFEVYDKNAVVSGWGRLNSTDPSAKASRLQKLGVKILTNEECRKLVKEGYEEVMQKNLTYEDTSKYSTMGVTETQLCGISKTNTSVCFGDSVSHVLRFAGGPLIIQNEEDGRYFQAGIISYGLGKCRTDIQIPGSYTNIGPKYIDKTERPKMTGKTDINEFLGNMKASQLCPFCSRKF